MRCGTMGVLVLLAFAPSTAYPQVPDDPRGFRPGRHDGGQAEVQARIEGALKRALPAVVRIQDKEDSTGFSGAIVTEDGYVATCAHHFLLPGTSVTVTVADGRKVGAEVLGSHRYWDISLVRIKGEGKWPRIEFGKSAAMRRDDLCIALGYPALRNRRDEAPEIKVRVGRVVYSAATGMLQTSCLIGGGDSGGPLLDLDGRLIGIHRGMGSLNFAGSLHAGAELFQDIWDELAARRRVELAPRGLGPFGDMLRGAIADFPPITVDVLCDGQPTLLGTIVDPDGWVLTKASDLDGRITCQLADGRTFEAVRCGTSRTHDLAMLKIDARGLPTIRWARETPPVGTLVVAPGCRTRWSLAIGDNQVNRVSATDPARDASASAGVVSHSRRKIAPLYGFPCFDVEEAEGGLRVTRIPKQGVEVSTPLRVGDLIIQVASKPTPNLKAYEEVLREHDVAGDPVGFSVRRDGRDLELTSMNHASYGVSMGIPLSHRRTGFPDVFSTDLDLSPRMCGGPLVALNGEVIGINIARDSEVESYTIPGDVVRGVIDSLKSGAPQARETGAGAKN